MAIARPEIAATTTPIGAPFEVRRIGNAEIRKSLAQGWDDFQARRGDLIVVGLLYPFICLVAAVFFLGGNLVHLLFPAAAGISLLGPVAALGFYELARRREDGLESGWSHFLDVRKRPAWNSIMTVIWLLLVIFILWIVTAAILYNALLGPAPESVADLVWRVIGTPEGWALIVIGNLVGLAFAALVLTLSVVSMPMLVDRNVDARTAIETSVRATIVNRWTMARWGFIVAFLLILGSIPAFIGLAVVLPVLGYATWHLYTHVVVRG